MKKNINRILIVVYIIMQTGWTTRYIVYFYKFLHINYMISDFIMLTSSFICVSLFMFVPFYAFYKLNKIFDIKR